MSGSTVLTSERLALRPFDEGDAGFILELVNDAEWLRFIGDKQVQSLDDARRYLRDGPMAMQARHGHGLCCVERRSDGSPIGMCGLTCSPVAAKPTASIVASVGPYRLAIRPTWRWRKISS